MEYHTGHSVSLSDDGMTVAVSTGDCDCDQDGTVNSGIRGYIKVLKYSNTSSDWVKLGDNIIGEGASDRFGHSVSISDDGTIVSGSAFYNPGDGGPPAPSGQGHIRVFNWNGTAWSQIGNDINGNNGDEMGRSISISSDGKKVAGGAINKNPGLARVYQYRDPHVTLSSASLLPEVADEMITDTATLEIASSRGRKANKKIKLGICGEHGGDPKSIDFCSRTGLNYVSCSPFRVPIARLAAAQAELSK